MREGIACLLNLLAEDIQEKQWRNQWYIRPKVDIHFWGLGLVVGGKPILKGVTGEFLAGQMYAVMGMWVGCTIYKITCFGMLVPGRYL